MMYRSLGSICDETFNNAGILVAQPPILSTANGRTDGAFNIGRIRALMPGRPTRNGCPRTPKFFSTKIEPVSRRWHSISGRSPAKRRFGIAGISCDSRADGRIKCFIGSGGPRIWGRAILAGSRSPQVEALRFERESLTTSFDPSIAICANRFPIITEGPP